MSRFAEARHFGVAKTRSSALRSQKAVCFSEIPLHELSRLSKRRGPYGLGFTKSFARSRSINPIWYVEKDCPFHSAIEELMSNADRLPLAAIWKLTPLIDAPGAYGSSSYRFEWEREWRHVGDFRFSEEEVAFLIIPENQHEDAYTFFQDATEQNIGPGFLCPYIDANWDPCLIQKAFCKVAPLQ